METHKKIAPFERLSSLKEAINSKGCVRIIEAHSGLSALVGEFASAVRDGSTTEFDGIWESSLTDSATKGLPDASIVGIESRLHTINEILGVTTKPLIVDGDTGGEPGQFQFLVENLERLGVSAVIIEDKVFPKRNSLDNAASQTLEDPGVFARKITYGKQATLTEEFMIIARLESLIAGTGLDDALHRAETYIAAGVDGIMIHSNQREPRDLFEFVRRYDDICNKHGRRPILVGVPTTYNQYSDVELEGLGFNVIIHANHLLRASHMAMKKAAGVILESGSSQAADEISSPVSEIFQWVGLDRVIALDREQDKALQVPVLIPAAGRDPIFPDVPKSLIPVAGRPIMEYQLEAIRGRGFKRVVVITGHNSEAFEAYPGVTLVKHERYQETHSLASLMVASDEMNEGFLLVYSDILFDSTILSNLVNSKADVVLAIDNSYAYHKHEIDKKLDLVVTRKRFDPRYRKLKPSEITELVRIGKDIGFGNADYEFIGLAYFSPRGVEVLRQIYQQAEADQSGAFHEAVSFQKASITDIIQEMIDRGFSVHGLEVNQGWMEIHTPADLEVAEREMGDTQSGHSKL